MISSYAMVKKLKDAGFTDHQAEALTEAVKSAQESRLAELATKWDVTEAKLEIIKWMVGASGVVIAAIKVLP